MNEWIMQWKSSLNLYLEKNKLNCGGKKILRLHKTSSSIIYVCRKEGKKQWMFLILSRIRKPYNCAKSSDPVTNSHNYWAADIWWLIQKSVGCTLFKHCIIYHCDFTSTSLLHPAPSPIFIYKLCVLICDTDISSYVRYVNTAVQNS